MSIKIENNHTLKPLKLDYILEGEVFRNEMNKKTFVKLPGGYLQITDKLGNTLNTPIVMPMKDVSLEGEYFYKLDQTVTIEI